MGFSYPLPLPDEVQDCLGRATVFSTLQTDHAPLQWLSSLKMEGLLSCQFRSSTLTLNTARVLQMQMQMLSHAVKYIEPQKFNVTTTLLDTREADLQTAQQHDPNMAKI